MRVHSLTIDLDGTLVDSVADLAAASNAMLADLGRESRSQESVRSFVGRGMQVLVERCLDGEGTTPPAVLAAGLASFRRHYATLNGVASRPYPGVVEGLESMRREGLRLACVTNKPAEFTGPLLERLGLAGFFDVVVAGDTIPYKKPRPEPLLHACAVLGTAPAANIHVGDSRHDVEAARAAGCRAFVVPYGYEEPGRVDTAVDARLVSGLVEAAEVVARFNRDPDPGTFS